MDLNGLRKMTLPKLRDRAKQVTDLQGVIGMHKEELIRAIAKAEGISYESPAKDANAIHQVKQEIRGLKKQKAELLASSRDRKRLKRVQRKIRRLKRLTRKLAHEAKQVTAAQPTQPAQPGAPAGSPPAAG